MKTRMKTRDEAFKFRMSAGFAGDINRVHPFSVEPCLNDADNPVTAYGLPVVLTATGTVRPFNANDDAVTAIYGISVRPYPIQQPTATNYGAVAFGGGTPPAGVIDILRAGYIMVKTTGAPVKGGTVYVFTAVDEAGHTLGTFEGAEVAGKVATIANAKFNGAPDANGVVELYIQNL